MDEQMNLKISASPHVRSKDTTSDIMFDVVLALAPATAFGLYLFGWYAALLVAVCILSCVGFEALFQKLMGKKVTVGDFSAVVTGLLLALNLPPKLPIWMAVVGSAFAIIVVKQLFGGLGQNFMNPALAARCFLILSFARYMTDFYYDGVATATPLAVLKQSGQVESLRSMFLGHTAGTIGETSVAALLIGAIYLLARRIINFRIPVFYIGTFAAAIAIYGFAKGYDVPVFLAAHLCGGGLMLGAWFMATDYVTSPITSKGKIIYGIFLGLLTFVLRIFGPSAEGVSYSIIIGNLIVPLIERVTVPKAFGAGMGKKEEKPVEAKEEEKEEAKEAPAEKTRADMKGVLLAVLAISVITVLMGSILGVMHEVTKDPIASVEKDAKEEAYKEVFPDAGGIIPMDEAGTAEQAQEYLDQVNTTLHDIKGFKTAAVTEIAFACESPAGTKQNKVLGYVVLVTNKGYGGDMQLAVGVSSKGEVKGISFLSINETAGLGMKANTDAFKDQFKGKTVDAFKFTKTGSTAENEIDALSGATITTTAVTDAVNAAVACVNLLGGGN